MLQYGPWLAQNQAKLKPDELHNYRKQHEYMERICAVYESSLAAADQSAKALELMQEAQCNCVHA